MTPENEMKWTSLEPTQGNLNWAPADQLVNFAVKNNMKMRGHTLLWYQQTPKWVEDLKGNKTELAKAMEKHIRYVS